MNAVRQQHGRARPAPPRNSDLAQIHIAKKQLGMDDDAYRDMLFAVARVRSAKQLDHVGRAKVLDHLKRCGFRGASSTRPKRPTPAPEVAAMCRKVRAQLIALGKLPDTYADGIAQRMYGVQFYEWLQADQLHDLVAALQIRQRRMGAPEA